MFARRFSPVIAATWGHVILTGAVGAQRGIVCYSSATREGATGRFRRFTQAKFSFLRPFFFFFFFISLEMHNSLIGFVRWEDK